MEALRYYRFLATTLPAMDLAGLAWRRVRRATFRRVQGLKAMRRPVSVTAALGVRTPDELARKLREHRATRAAIEPNERAEARRLISANFSEHAREIAHHADRILNGELLLFGSWREHSRDELAHGIAAIDWTRDPLAGGHAPSIPSHEIDRDAPGTDSRATWEAARLAWVYRLAQAHLLRGLPGTEGTRGAREPSIYVRALVLHVRDFLATQPVGLGIHWTCPMEAALRLLHLLPAVLLVRDAPELDALFWSELAESVLAHARFIERELEDTQAVPGNHLLTDLAGLVAVGLLLPELPGAARWRTDGLRAFSEELIRQTTPEGLAFEASLPYHRFTTELGLLVQSMARRQGLTLAAPALGTLWKMCDFAEGATLPDGRLPAIGDNDSTRAFNASDRDPLDARHLGAVRSALGGPGIARSIEPEALWLGGVAGLRRNLTQSAEQLREHAPRHHVFSRAGLTVLRDEDGRAVTLWAGANGQRGLGGHAHNDKLSSEVVLRGRRIVTDPGCPTYLFDPDERDRYRSTAAHPTVQIDHHEQADVPVGRPFLLPEAAHAMPLRTNGRTASAEHRGYLRVRPGVLHRREITLPDLHDVVCVTDWLLGEGAHVVELRWPLTTRDVELRPARESERIVLEALETTPSGESRFDLQRVFALASGAFLAIACEQEWEALLTESFWSPGYGERICNRVATIRLRAHCPVAVTSAFAWVRPARGLRTLTE